MHISSVIPVSPVIARRSKGLWKTWVDRGKRDNDSAQRAGRPFPLPDDL